MQIRAIKNHIVFQFVDEVTLSGHFVRSHESGLILGTHYDDSAKQHRWARVISAGPDCCDEIKQPGVEILIENLRWNEGAKLNGQKYWKTDENQLLGYRTTSTK